MTKKLTLAEKAHRAHLSIRPGGSNEDAPEYGYSRMSKLTRQMTEAEFLEFIKLVAKTDKATARFYLGYFEVGR